MHDGYIWTDKDDADLGEFVPGESLSTVKAIINSVIAINRVDARALALALVEDFCTNNPNASNESAKDLCTLYAKSYRDTVNKLTR